MREYLDEVVYEMLRLRFTFPLKEKYFELRQRMKSRKVAIVVARKLVVMMFSMLKKGTLFIVENTKEREEIKAYQERKVIVCAGKYNKFCKSCKDISKMVEITNTFHSNELGILNFNLQGA